MMNSQKARKHKFLSFPCKLESIIFR